MESIEQLPQECLDPRVKRAWRINDAIWLAIIFVVCFIPLAIVAVSIEEPVMSVILVAVLILFVLLVVLCLVILPPIRYARWRFSMNENYLDIAKGIVWRKRYIIPFIRVQNTDTRQGPILRMFGLSSVTVSTAAGAHEIPGLDTAQAAALRDKAAEFARLAREDV